MEFKIIENDRIMFNDIITSNEFKIWYHGILKLEVQKDNFIRYQDFSIIIAGIARNIGSSVPRLKKILIISIISFQIIKLLFMKMTQVIIPKNKLKKYLKVINIF